MLVFSILLVVEEPLALFLEDIMNVQKIKLSSMLRILGINVLKIRERNLKTTIR